jgi:multiple sugar transport system substrate-binding protein
MKSVFRSIFLLLVVFTLVLTACASPAATTEPAPVPTNPPTESQPTTEQPEQVAGGCPSIAQGQTIEMWSPLTGPDGDEMSALAKRFSDENPWKVTVKHVAQPEYIQKLNAAAAAKQLPAMTVVRAINIGELVERNVLKPISPDLLAVLGEDIASDFPALAWNAGEYEGQRYTIPLDIHPLVMYYNKDMFQKAGVPEPGKKPWTKDEFESALEKLAASGVQPIAIGTAFQGATLFQSFIRQFGGNLVNEDGTKVTYNSDAGVQALTYVKELKDKYSPEISGAGDPEVAVFKQGKAAIVIHGPWHISDLQKLPFVGFAPIPQVGSQPSVWAGSHQLGLTSDDPAQQAAAVCWIDWLSRNSLEWAKAGQIPARISVFNDPKLVEVAGPVAAFADQAHYAYILPPVAELEGALWGEFGAVVDGVLMGEITDVKAALAAAKSQQIVDQNAEKYK